MWHSVCPAAPNPPPLNHTVTVCDPCKGIPERWPRRHQRRPHLCFNQFSSRVKSAADRPGRRNPCAVHPSHPSLSFFLTTLTTYKNMNLYYVTLCTVLLGYTPERFACKPSLPHPCSRSAQNNSFYGA